MGEILGLGISHGPFVLYPEETMANMFRRALANPDLPAASRDPANWPPAARAEWGSDEGRVAAYRHRQQLVEGCRKARLALDRFAPDVVLIWGDDQYENFHEDIVPAYCVFIEEEFRVKPFTGRSGLGSVPGNVWGVGPDYELVARGQRQAAKALTVHLLNEGFEICYAYTQLYHDFGHAFWRTVAHLDYDRRGFPYPVVPFHVNSYGSKFVSGRSGGEPDPPGPSPERCFELGAAVAKFFRDSPYRAALVGSSSWSHASLSENTHYLWPNVDADKARYGELRRGDYASWKSIPLAELEANGQHEMLNWMCLAGAMEALGRKPAYTEFVESWIFNSCKTIAVFEP